jgi:phosphate transport system substrate-binding protein
MKPRNLGVAEFAERFEDHADLSDLVSIDPGGIGVTSFAYARGSRMLAIRQQCGLVSFPTSFSMKTEEYPLGRRLYAYGSDQTQQPSHPRGLVDFALSDAAQPIIAEAGFVDRDIAGQGIEVQGVRLAHSLTSPEEFSLPVFREMLTEIKDGERLSITFRFNLGSSNLETRSQSEAERFARLLAAGAYPGKDIILVGFTDSIGEFEVNRGLAVRRAQSVLDTLGASAGAGALDEVSILVQSYGELTPVGCNETNEGRELNRRVEVWVRDKRG